jgi:hypothetical protein
MVGIITQKTKEKAKRRTTLSNQSRERGSPSGSYFTHSPSNIVSLQIMRSNNNRRFRTNIFHFAIFLSARKAILKSLSAKLNAKR